MGFISWIIFGALAGWLVSLIMKTDGSQGALGNIVVGIVGAVIGGWVGGKVLGVTVTGFNVKSLLVAIAGGIIFTVILGAVTGKKSV